LAPVIIRLLSTTALLASTIAASALTDEKTEGTANPEPIPALADEKAILATAKFPEGMGC
jgi:hypothetical protein